MRFSAIDPLLSTAIDQMSKTGGGYNRGDAGRDGGGRFGGPGGAGSYNANYQHNRDGGRTYGSHRAEQRDSHRSDHRDAAASGGGGSRDGVRDGGNYRDNRDSGRHESRESRDSTRRGDYGTRRRTRDEKNEQPLNDGDDLSLTTSYYPLNWGNEFIWLLVFGLFFVVFPMLYQSDRT